MAARASVAADVGDGSNGVHVVVAAALSEYTKGERGSGPIAAPPTADVARS